MQRVLLVSLGILCLSANLVLGDLADQPDSIHSYIYDVDYHKIYDFEFADMVSTYYSEADGPADMVFIFTQCHSGGMLDDLRDVLSENGDVALLSSCRYDQTSTIRDPFVRFNGSSGDESYYVQLLSRALGAAGKDISMKEMAERMAAANPCEETYQWYFLGNGGDIRLDSLPGDGEVPPERRFALLFVGEDPLNTEWAYRELIDMHEALLARGFIEENIVVLAGKTKGDIPFADGPGKRMDLVGAIRDVFMRMSSDASFFFWTTGHGSSTGD